MAENIFQDSTADYSSKPLPERPSIRYLSTEMIYDSDKFLLIEDVTGEDEYRLENHLENNY
jgi:hypothetical protein